MMRFLARKLSVGIWVNIAPNAVSEYEFAVVFWISQLLII
jgi:hypothetical protein